MQIPEILQFYITNKQLSSWKCLDKSTPPFERTDCTLSSLSFMNVIDRDYAEKQAKIFNECKTGMCARFDITSHLFNRYAKELIEHYSVVYINPSTWKESILRFVKRNHGIIATFIREQPSIAHTIIVAVSDIGEIHLIDPQHQIMFTGANIDKYIQEQEFVGLVTYLKHSTKKRPIDKSIIRKRKTESPVTKKLKISKSKSKSKSRSNTTRKNN
jgi:hypothetical protein